MSKSNPQEQTEQKLHRLATVRKQERVSWKSLSRRSGIPIADLKRQEDETNDLLLSTLYRWHAAINVPVEELISEPNERISSSLRFKTQLIRVTKTVLLMLEQSDDEKTDILAKEILGQLFEIMPALKEVGPWPTRNYARPKTELPKILDQQISADWFQE